MMSPLIKYPDQVVALPPQYMGSVGYYALLAQYGHAVIDTEWRYDKRFKSAHRCDIASTHGRMQLTVPVDKDGGLHGRSWQQVKVSPHAQWWTDHVTALESAYGRTPFFEFYFDRFRSWLRRPDGITVGELDRGLDQVIRSILHLDTEVVYDMASAPAELPLLDMRRERNDLSPSFSYYQVRADRLGFISGLSIVDLIFNMGPEAPLILKKMQLSTPL